MGTKLIVTEDTSERVVVTEKSDTSSNLMLTRKKIIFDKLLQRVVKQSGFLFFRRAKEIPFSDIEAVEAQKRTKRVGGGHWYTNYDYCELMLLLRDGKTFNLGRGWLDRQTKEAAERIAEVMRKPLVWL